ncbi:MAG: arylsulfatase [Phycisphaerae bacterium]|nr:arylsulfatase [Phycisphaerae bacterium]
MKRRQFLRTVGAGVSLALAGKCLAADSAPVRKPNIVLINADDLGFGDLGCYGATKVKTPNIDRLAKQGRMFTDAHSASAVCTPSRYALLTGRYPFRNKGLWGPVMLRSPLVIDPKQLTLGKLMKDAGYSTACIGKWHLGFGDKTPVDWNKPLKPGPLELGFDYYFGVPVVNSHPPFVYVENHRVVGLTPDDPMVYRKRAATKAYPEKMGLDWIGGAKAAHQLYNDETVGATLTGKAVKWIEDQKANKKGFFLYLATTNIHHPFTPAPRFKGASKCGRYGDFIAELDWIVGQVLAAIDKIEARKNTLVIFTSDNGGMLNQGGQAAWKAGHRLNADLLGFKFDAWEGGHRIPFIARWPGSIPPDTKSDQLICNVDMLATLAAIVGRKLPPDGGPDSFNVMGAMTGSPKSQIRDHLVICPRSPNHIALRKGKWVYIGAKGNGGFTGRRIGQHTLGGPAAHKLTKHTNSDIADGRIKKDAPPAQLYDLQADPGQTKNLYNQQPEVVKQMQALLDKCRNFKRTANRRREGPNTI